MLNDFTTDNNPTAFQQLYDNNLIPNYVVNSERITQESVKGLNKVAFADRENRLYPCHSKEATWQSAVYIASRNVQDEVIIDNLKKSASAQGITEDIESVFAHFEDVFEKVASNTVESDLEQIKFALALELDDELKSYYPIDGNDATICKSATQAMNDYRTLTISLPMLYEASKTFVKEASEFALSEMPKKIVQLGTPRLPSSTGGETIVNMRKAARVGNIEAYEACATKLAEAIEKAASLEEAVSSVEPIIAKITELDVLNNVKYSFNNEDPYTMVFSGPLESDFDKAAAMTVDIKGVYVPTVDFLNMRDKTIETLFSKEASATIIDAKRVLEGTPTIAKAATAASKLKTLQNDEINLLLERLAFTGW